MRRACPPCKLQPLPSTRSLHGPEATPVSRRCAPLPGSSPPHQGGRQSSAYQLLKACAKSPLCSWPFFFTKQSYSSNKIMQRHKSRCTAPKVEQSRAGRQELTEHHQSLNANFEHVERPFTLIYRRTALHAWAPRRAQQLSVFRSNITLRLASSGTLLQHSEMQRQLCRDILNCPQAAQWGAHQQMSGTAICLRAKEKHGAACVKAGAQLD